MGDANAQVGGCNVGYEDVMGRFADGTMTENGDMFANMCSLNSLIIGGSIFPHKRVHKGNWISTDKRTENQIEHFCLSLKYRCSLQDVKR